MGKIDGRDEYQEILHNCLVGMSVMCAVCLAEDDV